MFCPECNQRLIPLTVKNDTGNFTAHCCMSCAGIWTESGAANLLTPQDITYLMSVVPKKGAHPIAQYNLCPKDRQTLELYKGENVPPDVTVFRCSKCNGFWFPEGMLPKFKRAQAAKIDYFKAWHIPLPSIHAVLLPILVMAILGTTLLITLSGIREQQDIRSRATDPISKPVVTYPAPAQVFISFTTKTAATSRIRYWTDPQVVMELPVVTTPTKTHSIVLSNLETGKTYSYQLILSGTPEFVSQVLTFTTQ